MSPQSIKEGLHGGSMSIRPTRAVLAALAATSIVGWIGASAADEATATAKVHVDGKAMERAAVRASASLLRDDPVAAKQALKQLDAACRRLNPEEDETFGPGARTLDQALHKVLGNTREYVGAGEMDRAFDEFTWVQRTCRQCHVLAREHGLLPSKGPLWPDPIPPTKRVETTQFVGQKP
jgi:hypothetical protein